MSVKLKQLFGPLAHCASLLVALLLTDDKSGAPRKERPICRSKGMCALFPLDRAHGLRGQVVADAADAGDFVSDTVGHTFQERPIKLRHFGGHDVHGVDGADDGRHTRRRARRRAHQWRACRAPRRSTATRPRSPLPSPRDDGIGLAQGLQTVVGDGAEAAHAQTGAGEGWRSTMDLGQPQPRLTTRTPRPCTAAHGLHQVRIANPPAGRRRCGGPSRRPSIPECRGRWCPGRGNPPRRPPCGLPPRTRG